MSELGRHIFVRMIENLWEFAKDKAEQKRIGRMTPAERENYYVEEGKKIHERAVRLADLGRQLPEGRDATIRRLENMMRSDRRLPPLD